MSVKESDKYYLKEFGDNPRYDALFGEYQPQMCTKYFVKEGPLLKILMPFFIQRRSYVCAIAYTCLAIHKKYRLQLACAL